MKILIACDKFKGSISAGSVCASIAKGLKYNDPSTTFCLHPIADGGDGSLSIVENYTDSKYVFCQTLDPFNRPISSKFLLADKIAFIELAEASGIARISKEERNPLITNSIGTGIVIKEAIKNGAKHIVLMLGGSCTNDCGFGIAYKLGYRFFNDIRQELIPCGGNLLEIQSIKYPRTKQDFRLTLLCDVTNPLYGKNGAAYTYARQKGANDEDIVLLDNGLRHVAKLIYDTLNIDIQNVQGSGSAGGIGGGLMALLNGELISGFEYLATISDLENKIKEADFVITGEGKLDQSSLNGKVVSKIGSICAKHRKPLIAIVGSNDLSPEDMEKIGLSNAYSILALAKDESDSIMNAGHYIELISRSIAF